MSKKNNKEIRKGVRFEAKYLNSVLDTGSTDLKGFMVAKEIPEIIPSMTLDSFSRLYFNADVRNILGLVPYQRITAAYNPSKRMFAITIHPLKAAPDGESVPIDKRYYANVKDLADYFGLNTASNSPIRYDYVGESSVKNVHLFALRGKEAG